MRIQGSPFLLIRTTILLISVGWPFFFRLLLPCIPLDCILLTRSFSLLRHLVSISPARAWTNFEHQEASRDNIEPQWSLGFVENTVDVSYLMSARCFPLTRHSKALITKFILCQLLSSIFQQPMWLPTSEGRDVFPKLTLDVNHKVSNGRGYVGDKVQRCDSMPSKPWLRKGAIYQFRENPQSLMGKKDPNSWANDGNANQLVLDSQQSRLYQQLCNYDLEKEACDFKSTVALGHDIPCTGRCVAGPTGNARSCECSIDEPRTVILYPPNSPPVWYEYVKAPCVQLAFPEPGNLRTVREIGATEEYGNKAMCADSRYAVAGTTCCDSDGMEPFNICVFRGERTTFMTASARCEALGYTTCDFDHVDINSSCGTDIVSILTCGIKLDFSAEVLAHMLSISIA